MSIAPLVRRVIVCHKVEVTNPGPNQEYVIRGVLDTVRPEPAGTPFPFRARGMWIFVQFTDGDGTHTAKLRVIREHDRALISEWSLPPIRMTIGRLAVLSRAYRLPEIPFPEPGVYEFRIVCGESVASDTLRVEAST